MWLAFDTTYYDGGQTTLEWRRQAGPPIQFARRPHLLDADDQEYSLKFSWSRGATTRIGSNFTNYGVGLQYAWLDKH